MASVPEGREISRWRRNDVAGAWVVGMEANMPPRTRQKEEWRAAHIRMLSEWQVLTPETELRRLEVLENWMWEDLLPYMRPPTYRDPAPLGIEWDAMLKQRTSAAIDKVYWKCNGVWGGIAGAVKEVISAKENDNPSDAAKCIAVVWATVGGMLLRDEKFWVGEAFENKLAELFMGDTFEPARVLERMNEIQDRTPPAKAA